MTDEEFKEQMELQKEHVKLKSQYERELAKECYLDILACRDILKNIDYCSKPCDKMVRLPVPKSVSEFKQEKLQIDWLEKNGYIGKSLIEAHFDYIGKAIPHYEIGALTLKGKEMLNEIKNLNENDKFWVRYYNFKYFKCWNLEKICLVITAFSTLITLLISFISFIKQ